MILIHRLVNLNEHSIEKISDMVTIIKKGATAQTIKKKYEKVVSSPSKKDIRKYCGVISLKKNPVDLQKEWRDEWK